MHFLVAHCGFTKRGNSAMLNKVTVLTFNPFIDVGGDHLRHEGIFKMAWPGDNSQLNFDLRDLRLSLQRFTRPRLGSTSHRTWRTSPLRQRSDEGEWLPWRRTVRIGKPDLRANASRPRRPCRKCQCHHSLARKACPSLRPWTGASWWRTFADSEMHTRTSDGRPAGGS